MSEIIPIFRSEHSLLKSVLTVEPAEEIKELSPVSIFTIAKTHNLKDIYILDESYSGFISAYKAAEKGGFNLRYGIQFYCCSDINKKDEDSLSTEHKINIWASSTDALKALQKIYSKAHTDGFYYQGRIDLKTLKEFWREDLILTIPFYDSFLFNNLMYFNRNLTPDLADFNPIFFIETPKGLPFDSIIKNTVTNYTTKNSFEIQIVSTVYYYQEKDFYQYMVLRCISNRTTLSKPNFSFLSSNKFSFESYLKNKI